MTCAKCKKTFGGGEEEEDLNYCPTCRNPDGSAMKLLPGVAKRPPTPSKSEPKRKVTRNNPLREPGENDGVINPKPVEIDNPEGYVNQSELAKALKEHAKNSNLDKDKGTPLSP